MARLSPLGCWTFYPTIDQLRKASSMTDFIVKDSGRRSTYLSGMVRDTEEGKIDYTTAINGPMFGRLAAHLTKGLSKYPDRANGLPNWMLSDSPDEYNRARKSAFRHFIQWFQGDIDEDHAAAVFFNINLAEYVKDRIRLNLREAEARATALEQLDSAERGA